MRIKQIKIKNFRGFGENPTSYEGYYTFDNLDQNKLIILNGFNGFGKTSFFDAVEWCLTGDIKRIRDIEDTAYVKNLKLSHYLKFFKENDEKVRVTEVVLVFDDDTYIRRITKAQSLHEASYTKNTRVFDKEGNEIDITTVWGKIIESSQLDISEFMEINYLGQEKMNAFLRSKTPKDRTASLMKLIGQAKLSNIVEGSKSDNFRKLNSHISSITTRIDELQSASDKINELFEINGWGPIEDYIPKLQEIYLDLIHTESELLYRDKWKIKDTIDKDSVISEENFIDVMDKYNKHNKNLKSIKEGLKQRQVLLLELQLLRTIIQKYKKLKNIEYIANKNYPKLDELKKDYENKIIVFEQHLKKVDDYEEISNVNANIFSELIERIDVKKYSIKNAFWDELFSERTKCSSYLFLMRDYIENKSDMQFISDVLLTESWIGRKNKYEKYVKLLKKIGDLIRANENAIKNYGSLNDSYNEVLLSTKKFLVGQEEVSQCPICLNEDFSKIPQTISNTTNNNVKAILLDIIDFTIANGNDKVKILTQSINHKRKRYERLLNSLEEEIIKPIIDDLEIIVSKYNSVYDYIKEKIYMQHKCIEKHLDFYKEKLIDIQKEMEQFSNIIKYNLNLRDIDTEGEYNKAILFKKKLTIGHLTKLKDILSAKVIPIYSLDFDEIQKRQMELENIYHEYEQDENTVKKTKMLIYDLNKIINKLDELNKLYIVDEDDKRRIEIYYKDKKNIDKLTELKTEFEIIKSNQEQLDRNSEYIQKELIEKVLKKNAMVQWVYDRINPHPYFNKLEFDYDKIEGTNIKYADNNGLYLDHIFSSAQLNVLALSIFLGLGLTQKCTKLDQIFLDDPIQSMDDINILSYIDLIRSIFESKKVDKNIIISTHDDNFAKLLAIKMRNKDYMMYNFVAYGEEGPVIEC